MPTGYTADVADGKVADFETFALRCAREFGACVMQREDRMDEPPKLPAASTYNAERLAVAEVRLADLQKMTVEEAGVMADAEHAQKVEEHRLYAAKRRQTRDRYEAMLRDVERWTPPTTDHYGLKKFMRDQLNESIRFDCDFEPEPPKHQTGEEWLAAQRASASRDIGYHRAEQAAEVERTEGRHKWIIALYRSLNLPVPEVAP